MRVEKLKVDAAMKETLMMVNALKKPKDPLNKEEWPRDFFHALVSPDWREWVGLQCLYINSMFTQYQYSIIVYYQYIIIIYHSTI